MDARRYEYRELRDLYAQSAFVVVPLYENDFQAGVTTMLEAMAMGKAVIATRTTGQTDVIIDGENGLTVAPGDVDGWRRGHRPPARRRRRCASGWAATRRALGGAARDPGPVDAPHRRRPARVAARRRRVGSRRTAGACRRRLNAFFRQSAPRQDSWHGSCNE